MCVCATHMVVKIDLNRNEVIYGLLTNHAKNKKEKIMLSLLVHFFTPKILFGYEMLPLGMYITYIVYIPLYLPKT